MSATASASARAAATAPPSEVAGIDIMRLLQPVPGPAPVGVSLRYEEAYDGIREARRDEDPSLPQGVWRRDLKRANWNEVVALCTEALSERSKDLQIACWLVEALVHRDGIVGLATGLHVIVGLSDAFWPDLFPAIEDGDLSGRLAPLEWLNDKLPAVLYMLPLTGSDATDTPVYTWTDYVNTQRQELTRGGDTRGQRTGQRTDTLTLHDFFASAAETSTSFYETVADDIAHGLDAIEELSSCLGRWCGKDAPSLAQLRGALDNLQGFVDALLTQRDDKSVRPSVPVLLPVDATDAETDPDQFVDEAQALPARIHIRSRDEAYRLLMEIADYLFLVEPHSPTPYIVQRAASWGSMPLHKLLVELTKGNNDLTALFELLGLGREGSPVNGASEKR